MWLVAVGRLFGLLGREGAGEVDEHRAQVRTESQEVRRAAPAGEQKRDRREISLGRNTGLAGKDEIVAPIVGGLTAAGRHVVERHRGFREPLTAVGTDGTMLLEEPSPRFGVGDASGGVRGELDRAVRCAALGALLSASRAAPSSRAGAFGIEHFMVSPDYSRATVAGSMMVMRRTARSATGAMVLRGPVVAIGRVVKLSRQNVMLVK